MKNRIILIAAITTLSIFLLLLILPLVFHKKAQKIIEQEIHQHTEAQVDIGRLRLSFVRNFPNVTLSLHNIRFNHKAEHANEISGNIGTLRVIIGIGSLINDDTPAIRQAQLHDSHFDILIMDEAKGNTVLSNNPDMNRRTRKNLEFLSGLQRVTIVRATLGYHNKLNGSYLEINDLNVDFRNTFADNTFNIRTQQASIAGLSLSHASLPELNDVDLNFHADVTIDPKSRELVFNDNEIIANGQVFRFNGKVAQIGSKLDVLLNTQLGESDLAARGQIQQISDFFRNGETLSAHFDIRSNHLDLNSMIKSNPSNQENNQGLDDNEYSLPLIRIPENLDLSLHAEVGQLKFGNMDITNLKGNIELHEQQARMHALSFDILGGFLSLNGIYDSSDELPDIVLGIGFNAVDFFEAFNTFKLVRILAPAGRYVLGDISGELDFQAQLDKNLQPLAESLSGAGSINTQGLTVSNNPIMLQLAERLQLDMLREFVIGRFDLQFGFSDGRVGVHPFDIQIGQSKLSMGGYTYFDLRIDYMMELMVPYEQFGSRTAGIIDLLSGKAAERGLAIDPGDNILLRVTIGGTLLNPNVSFGSSDIIKTGMSGLGSEAGSWLQGLGERLMKEFSRYRIRPKPSP